MKKIILIFLVSTSITSTAQNSKVQSAWRNISDYETSFDTSALSKAKEAIHIALAHEKTKDEPKTWVYDSKVHYYLFRENFKTEFAKLNGVSNVSSKNELTYGNVEVSELKESFTAISKAAQLDKDASYKSDIDKIQAQIVGEVNNVAIGKYKLNKFLDAADFFVLSYQSYKAITEKKDTNSLSNAVISAQKSLNNEKIIYVNTFMINENIAIPYTYQSLYEAQLVLKDSASALKTLKTGRLAYPNDISLMNKETEFYLMQGKQNEALVNLNMAIDKSPNTAILYRVRGNVYDNTANPKGNNKGKDVPKNYEELMVKAEADYKKAAELEPGIFDIWYNIGALYNNWGVYFQTKADAIVKMNAEQKSLSDKAQEMFKKAIPALETALTINTKEESVMFALRKLYLLTGDTVKAAKMSERLRK